MKVLKPLAFALIILFLLSSCVGVSMDIALNQNGSGTLSLEYSVSRSLEALGRLDGNERWNTIPLGRADFERTMDRLPEMRLLSFSSGENEKNLVINVKMEFQNFEGLLAFLDSGGLRSSFSGDARSGRLFLVLNEEGTGIGNSGLDKLISEISASYSVRMAVSFPSEGSLNLKDGSGSVLSAMPGSEIQSKGKQVSFSIPLYEVISYSKGLNVEFLW